MNKKIDFLSCLKFLLIPFAALYGCIIWMRNKCFDWGLLGSEKFSTPVITVGNLNVGGTGKTPHVEYLIRLLRNRYRVATMSRGYKRRSKGFLMAEESTTALEIGDEPMQYHTNFPGIVVSVAEDRREGIVRLKLRKPEVQVILLDDAYQHRSVRAGFNLLITEYARPYFRDHLLPFGRLREGRAGAKRADIIIVSKCPAVLDENEAAGIRKKLRPASNQSVFFTNLRYGEPYDFFSGDPVSLNGKKVILVCGIARPQPLVKALEEKAVLQNVMRYPDHYYFVPADVKAMEKSYAEAPSEDLVIVTTEKDASRLHLHRGQLQDTGMKIAVLPVQITFLFDAQLDFNEKIEKFITSYLKAVH